MKYDSLTGIWYTGVGVLKEPRYSTRSVTLGEEIVTLGGTGGERNVEAYNPATNTWRELPQMLRPRKDYEAVVLNGKIYVVGGYIDDELLGVVEVYSP
jgi:kelch-like protein 2/3